MKQTDLFRIIVLSLRSMSMCQACHSPQCVGKSVVRLENIIFHAVSEDTIMSQIRVRNGKHIAHCRIYDGCLHIRIFIFSALALLETTTVEVILT
jgi:hypothetical protein